MVFRRNDRSTEFFENWLTRYVEDNRAVKFDISKTGSLGGQDQPTLRHALYDAVLAGMRFYALPPIWNTRALAGAVIKRHGSFEIRLRCRRDSSPRNVHVAVAASPRLVSAECPRRGPQVAATRPYS